MVEDRMKKMPTFLKYADINKLAIRTDPNFPNTYIIDIPLESMPNQTWQLIFEETWKTSRHFWDRKLFVVGDKLRLVTTIDEIPEKLVWVINVVEETNSKLFREARYHEREMSLRISPGISVKNDEIRIDLKELKPNVFYKFYYNNETYIAHKVNQNILEIYEVLE
jgi:hypothetical protein